MAVMLELLVSAFEQHKNNTQFGSKIPVTS